MQSLRHAHALARFVLVWFALSLGVAMASPVVQSQPGELICSGAGVMTVLHSTDGSSHGTIRLGMDCPLCASHSALPPPVVELHTPAPLALTQVLHGGAAVPLASLAAVSPPARGPPVFS